MTGGLGWIGAAIALATTVASGLFANRQAKQQKKANQEAYAAQQELALAENQASLIELEKMKIAYAQAEAQRQAELAAEKEKEKKIVKYGAIIATGFILYNAMKD